MYHKTTVVGRVGQQPTMRYTADGTPVTSFSVAVNEKWGSGDDRKEKTTWYRVSAWKRLAELTNEYLSPGSLVLVEGTMVVDDTGGPRVWTDQGGTARASLEITAREVKFLGGKRDAGESNDGMPF